MISPGENMKFTNFGKMIQVAAFGAAITFGINGTAAFAGTISVTYLGATVQTPSATTSVETFDNATLGNYGALSNPVASTLTTTFNNNAAGITGTYSGAFTIASADVFGGAGGTGNYITTTQGDGGYTLTLSTGVNYFGYWLSALDAGNQVQLEDNGTVVYTFVPQDLISALGTCPKSNNVTNPYCGNPNGGGNTNQLYAYVNFFDQGGTFNQIVYTETINNAGYESDNDAVANLTTAPGGTPLNPIPEPSSVVLIGTGVLGVAGSLRRKLFSR
jgi:hypothetical protein